ncbi:single stranded DNA-binding domain-containing protein [Desulfogranum japonicum]|uniref:hypothetical protein n=1 Tax=Desulfogranum japonicum TaxID=231447 RepID=UPI0004243FE9|nr:hypothetical protein [Desulfogranum japonicum]
MTTGRFFLGFLLVIGCIFGCVYATLAAEYTGWEADSAYNRLYQKSELDRIKGDVVKVMEIVPMPGMSTGVALLVRDELDETVTVHLGPKSFLGDSFGIRRGDRIKVRGAWAELDGKDIFMAAKIKKGDHYTLKLRFTKNGEPFWLLSPEELAKERAAD